MSALIGALGALLCFVLFGYSFVLRSKFNSFRKDPKNFKFSTVEFGVFCFIWAVLITFVYLIITVAMFGKGREILWLCSGAVVFALIVWLKFSQYRKALDLSNKSDAISTEE